MTAGELQKWADEQAALREISAVEEGRTERSKRVLHFSEEDAEVYDTYIRLLRSDSTTTAEYFVLAALRKHLRSRL